MSELSRPLSVRNNTRQFPRLSHDEVLESIEQHLDITEVNATQITESSCFVSVVWKEAKEKLIVEGVNIRETFNNVFGVDKIVTNVTTKDAPVTFSYSTHENFRCKSSSHITRDCTNDIVCNYCYGQGYKRQNAKRLLSHAHATSMASMRKKYWKDKKLNR